jgi:hypothetical protein
MIMMIEFGAKFGDLNISHSPLFIQHYTVFQVATILHQLFPFYAHGVAAIQLELHVDVEQLTIATLQNLCIQNEQALKTIEVLKTELRSLKRASGAGATTTIETEATARTPRAKVHPPVRRQNMLVSLWNSVPGFIKAMALMYILRAVMSSEKHEDL